MREFIRICQKKERLIIGVMSGTSLDGVDLALVRLAGSGVNTQIELVEFHAYPMPKQWRKRIQAAFSASVEEICRINFDLGEFFATTILSFCSNLNIDIRHLDAIGFHGQTLYHVDRHSTLQTGEADVIAQRTNTLVVSDFRTADIAAGGSGAPLVPYLDNLLFAKESRNIALQNLGGIGNITFLPGDKTDDIQAFDTGPANAILNELVEIITTGKHHYDKDGFLSRQGTVQKQMLKELLTHDYFSQPIPKSTGRELFGCQYVRDRIGEYSSTRHIDILRTFVSLIAQSIHLACREYLPPVETLYLSGGGAHHPILLSELKSLLGERKVKPFTPLNGITTDSKEAVAFALLAHERMNNIPTNLPTVTGAKKKTTLGKFSFPYLNT